MIRAFRIVALVLLLALMASKSKASEPRGRVATFEPILQAVGSMLGIDLGPWGHLLGETDAHSGLEAEPAPAGPVIDPFGAAAASPGTAPINSPPASGPGDQPEAGPVADPFG